ncbi:hypothetical protein DOTSEDRAFT_75510 [Lecanosticta acicola]|uniref:PAC domain-containing protein n=1 Tax=Lecanosticta acicola TaxID=111012 RepID=A0AAI8YYL5_9PEZI|nr:hypothetical protein DOTSEDRAFT_75510 [Lecanosticta acicola]
MEVPARTHNTFLKKLPFRKRHQRHGRPYQERVAADPPPRDSVVTAYHVRSLSTSATSVQHATVTNQPKDRPISADGSKESLADPRLSPQSATVPPYTPMPIPTRVSSAANIRPGDQAPGRTTRLQQRDVHGNLPNGDGEPDDLSLNLPGFDDDAFQPRPSVSRMASPIPGRSRPTSPRVNNRNGLVEMPSIDQFPRPPGGPPGRRQLVSDAGPVTLGDDALLQLQTPSPDKSDIQNTEPNVADDAESWDLIKPGEQSGGANLYSLEKRAEQLYSSEHLRIILDDPKLLLKFSTILRKYRPWRVPVLSHYLAACKALRALDYTNSLTRLLSTIPHDSALSTPELATNPQLEAVAKESFAALLSDDLHYYITHAWIKIVSSIVQRRITGTLPPHLLETSHGLAEVFCITDPSRHDNPIILASEAFTRHSGCSLEYVLGRNCRFMQGPGTTIDSVRRFAISCQEGKDHTEILVNYRRDGSPFLAMVLNAPLLDSRGKVRYFLGAQVDVSGLLRGCGGIESLRRLVEEEDEAKEKGDENQSQDQILPKEMRPKSSHSEFKALSDMFNAAELNTVRKTGGSLQSGLDYISDPTSIKTPSRSSRVLLEDGTDQSEEAEVGEPVPPDYKNGGGVPGNLPGIYKLYLLIRPYPSLRILFASPTLRTPGILQSPFLDRIGGSARMRQDLESALRHGRAVTAKIKWLGSASQNGEGEGKTRWIHCTPLIHYSGQVGLWMIVLVRPNPNDDSMSVLQW